MAPTEMNLGHILVAVPENATEQQLREAQAKAQRVQERARGGEDFAKLARENSDAPGAAQTGGVMGLRSPDRYPPLFVEAVQPLPQGGVSGVLRSAAGFHVLKVLDRRLAEAEWRQWRYCYPSLRSPILFAKARPSRFRRSCKRRARLE